MALNGQWQSNYNITMRFCFKSIEEVQNISVTQENLLTAENHKYH